MVLSESQIRQFHQQGHITIADVFDPSTIEAALEDLQRWSSEFLATLSEDQQSWYLEKATHGMNPALRKLDNPAHARDHFRRMATDPTLVGCVEQLIGKGVHVVFSQVFMKPPSVGGPKPIHQDNYYFGPDDPDAVLTAWIALDHATVDNGCLHFADGQHDQLWPHVAPDDEPFNLQIDSTIASKWALSPAPVPRGGVSFHHGNAPHQSSSNRSAFPRRAAVFHYLRNDAALVHSNLDYDPSVIVPIT